MSDEQLLQRCQTLEKYCRDLVQTNKVLDLENRVAIAQIVNLLNPDQLSNFTKALRYVKECPKTIEAAQIGKADPFPFAHNTGIQPSKQALQSKSSRGQSSGRGKNSNMPRTWIPSSHVKPPMGGSGNNTRNRF